MNLWLASRDPGDRDRPAQARQRPRRALGRALAVDGKTLRGARPCRHPPDGGPDGGRRPLHRLAGMDHTSRCVLAQRQVAGAPEEVTGFQPLPQGLDLTGVVVTADALHTHADAATFLVPKARPWPGCRQGRPAQPAGALQRPALAPDPELDFTADPGHGRVEERTLEGGAGQPLRLPHAAQVIQLTATAVTAVTATPAPAAATTAAPATGKPRRSMRSPACPSSRPAPPAWPAWCVALGDRKRPAPCPRYHLR